ncbi:MAG: acyl-CoA synthetase [Burkholderiaceae bacterium]
MTDRSSADQYRELYETFRWHVPDAFNIADACCRRWANDPGRIAIHGADEGGRRESWSYARLERESNRVAALLRSLGVSLGDRVAIVLPQRPEMAAALIACLRLGAIAMPLSVLFGPDALEYRLRDSGACAAIADRAALGALSGIRAQCPALHKVIAVDADDDAFGTLPWNANATEDVPDIPPADTRASDPAILIYTSGTTGAPKGALLPHSAILGNLPGFVASQDWFPRDGDVFWSPADWAWTGGMMDGLLPVLYFGMPIVGYRGRFSADVAFSLLQEFRVTNTFLFPTALKMMMKAHPAPRERFDLALRAVMSAGEAVGDAVFEWCRQALGITINEMFGQTEANYIVGNSAGRWPAKPGSMGRPYPGHRVAVIDDDGKPVAPGQIGDVALHRTDIHGTPDPILFLGYWNRPDATAAKFTGDWCRTGDLASVDADGYLWYQGRADDMFKAASYRIGPAEIENCLVKHPAVANAAVVPKPDAERGNLVKAFVVLTPGTPRGGDEDRRLAAALQEHVRGKLAPYEYPKEIEFIDTLPMTTTGKLQRRVLRQLEADRAAARTGS